MRRRTFLSTVAAGTIAASAGCSGEELGLGLDLDSPTGVTEAFLDAVDDEEEPADQYVHPDADFEVDDSRAADAVADTAVTETIEPVEQDDDVSVVAVEFLGDHHEDVQFELRRDGNAWRLWDETTVE